MLTDAHAMRIGELGPRVVDAIERRGLRRECLASGQRYAVAARAIGRTCERELGRLNGRAKLLRAIVSHAAAAVAITEARPLSTIAGVMGVSTRWARRVLAALTEGPRPPIVVVRKDGIRLAPRGEWVHRGWATSRYVLACALPAVRFMPRARRAAALLELRRPEVRGALEGAGWGEELAAALGEQLHLPAVAGELVQVDAGDELAGPARQGPPAAAGAPPVAPPASQDPPPLPAAQPAAGARGEGEGTTVEITELSDRDPRSVPGVAGVENACGTGATGIDNRAGSPGMGTLRGSRSLSSVISTVVPSPYPLAPAAGVDSGAGSDAGEGGAHAPSPPRFSPPAAGPAGRARTWWEIRREWPALTTESARTLAAPGGPFRSPSAAVRARDGSARMQRRRDLEALAGVPPGRKPRTRAELRALARELVRIRREEQAAVVDEGRRPDASTWERIRGRWARDARPAAWVELVGHLECIGGTVGADGAFTLELAGPASVLAVISGDGQWDELARRASDELDGRPVRITWRE